MAGSICGMFMMIWANLLSACPWQIGAILFWPRATTSIYRMRRLIFKSAPTKHVHLSKPRGAGRMGNSISSAPPGLDLCKCGCMRMRAHGFRRRAYDQRAMKLIIIAASEWQGAVCDTHTLSANRNLILRLRAPLPTQRVVWGRLLWGICTHWLPPIGNALRELRLIGSCSLTKSTNIDPINLNYVTI